jgi:hypothetical protein
MNDSNVTDRLVGLPIIYRCCIDWKVHLTSTETLVGKRGGEGGRSTSVTNKFACSRFVGRDSSVGIATRYRLTSSRIESRWGRDFPHSSTSALGSTHSYTVGTGVTFPGVKRPGRGVKHRLPSSAEVKERTELYLYSTFGPSWPVTQRKLHLPFLPVPDLPSLLAAYIWQGRRDVGTDLVRPRKSLAFHEATE